MTRSQLAPYLRQIGFVGGHHGPRASTATPLSWRSTDHRDPELSVKVNVVLGRPRGEPALAAGLGDHERRNNSSPLPHGLTEPRPPGPSDLPHIPEFKTSGVCRGGVRPPRRCGSGGCLALTSGLSARPGPIMIKINIASRIL